MKRLFILALACAALTSCGGGKGVALEQTAWKLTELDGQSDPAFAEGESFTFTLDGEGGIHGVGSCNRFFGVYKVEGKNGLDIEGQGMTRMMCPKPDLEARFLTTLEFVDSYEIAGDRLSLFRDGACVAVMTSYAPAEAETETETVLDPEIAVEGAAEI